MEAERGSNTDNFLCLATEVLTSGVLSPSLVASLGPTRAPTSRLTSLALTRPSLKVLDLVLIVILKPANICYGKVILQLLLQTFVCLLPNTFVAQFVVVVCKNVRLQKTFCEL